VDRHFVIYTFRYRYTYFFAEGGHNGIYIGEPDVTVAFAADKLLKHVDDGILFLGLSRLFFQYQTQPPQEIKIPVGGLHERAGVLRVEIRRDYVSIAIDAPAVLARFDLGEAFLSRRKDVTA